jgi:hypothetical protein
MAYTVPLITSLLGVDMEKALAAAHGAYMRRCAKCEVAQPITLFPKHKLGKHGYSPYCKACEAERTREYRKRKRGIV